MNTLHQIWLGSEVPEREQRWINTVKQHCGTIFNHHLWNLDELKATYPDEPIWKAVESIPDCVRKWALLCDYFRYIVIQPGDLYIDTDFVCTCTPQIDFDTNKLLLFGEYWDGQKAASGLLGIGKRFGQLPILRRCVRQKAEKLTAESLEDMCAALGPAFLRNVLRLHGINYQLLPRTEASHVQWQKTDDESKFQGALVHMGAASWVPDSALNRV